MANTAQARKRVRQAEKNRQLNVSMRSTMRTAIKKVRGAIESGDREAAKTAYQSAVPLIDRLARKGLIHKNCAARNKSRLSAHIKAL